MAGIGISLASGAAGPLMGLAVDYLRLNYALVIIGAAVIVFFAPVLITKAVKRGNADRKRKVGI